MNYLITWLLDNGFPENIIHLLSPSDFPGVSTGRGLLANTHINIHDTIIQVPRNLLFTRDLLPNTTNNNSNISEHTAIALSLLIEREKGESSFWKPYIDTIPNSFNFMPIYHMELCTKYLPIEILSILQLQISRFQSAYESASIAYPELLDKDHKDLFQWAWLAVNTRCISLNPSPPLTNNKIALAPFLDLLNHSHETDMTTYFDPQLNSLVIKTLTPFTKNSQVFICYSKTHDNGALFVEYGFHLGRDNKTISRYINLDIEIADFFNSVQSKFNNNNNNNNNNNTKNKRITTTWHAIQQFIQSESLLSDHNIYYQQEEDKSLPCRTFCLLHLIVSFSNHYSNNTIFDFKQWKTEYYYAGISYCEQLSPTIDKIFQTMVRKKREILQSQKQALQLEMNNDNNNNDIDIKKMIMELLEEKLGVINWIGIAA